jgi:L,D-peptidoglycan transpeptidase YkuD (ErfK/YbiS/YcfS/YnhG family)
MPNFRLSDDAWRRTAPTRSSNERAIASAVVMVSRRVFLFSPIALAVMDNALAATSSGFADLTYAAGRLWWPGGEARAVCGRSGVRADKREGDGASPAGSFALLQAYYRADRIAPPPTTGLPLRALRPEDGWVDDPLDPNYNRPVSLPYAASHEEMWRADGLYDLVVLIGYNTDPPVPGRGSAIFLHVANPDFTPTAGCIAVAREVLGPLLGLLGPGSTITIRL